MRNLACIALTLCCGTAWAQTGTSTPATTATVAPRLDALGLPPIDLPVELPQDRIAIVAELDDGPRITAPAHEIDSEALERFEYDDIHQIVTQVPGVYARGEDGYGLRPNIGLRGVNPDRSAKVTLLEDGILLGPAPYSAPAAYFFPITTRMVGVDVFKGPATLEHGPNTIGGAVDMATRRIPHGMEANLDLAGGMNRFGKMHASWGMSWKHFGLLLEGVHLRTDGFKELDGGGDTGFAKNEAMLKLRANTDPGDDLYHEVELKLGYADEGSNETYLGLSQADFDATPYRRYAGSQLARMQWNRSQVELTYNMSAEEFEVRVVGYRHDFARTWTKLNAFADSSVPPLYDVLMEPTSVTGVQRDVIAGQQDSFGPTETLLLGTNARNFVSQGVQVRGRWRPEIGEVAQTIELAARLHHDQIVRQHTAAKHLMVNGTLVPVDVPELLDKANVGSTVAGAFHLKDEIRWRSLLVAPIIRLEIIDSELIDRKRGPVDDPADPNPAQRTQVAVSPGIGLSYQITEWLQVMAGAYRGFSPVSPGQPESVEPEESIAYEGGLNIAHGGTKAQAVGFFNDYRNITGECTDSNGCGAGANGDQFNGGEVNVYGLEASLSQSVALPGDVTLAAEIDYTLTLSQFLTAFDSALPAFESVEVGDELAYVPVHSGAVSVRAFGETWGVDLLVRHVGQMRDIPGQGPVPADERVLDHTVVDLTGSWSPFEGSKIYAKIENLFDTPYMISRRPYGARPGRPFHFLLGFKYHFAAE